jgi:hypothetical protein
LRGLIVGVVWGAWHFLVNVWASGTSSGALSLAVFLPAVLFSFLPAYRVLMVWVYDRTEQSLLVAMLMHTSLTASTLILMPLAISGVPLVSYDLVLAGALWVVVGAVAVVGGGHISRDSRSGGGGWLERGSPYSRRTHAKSPHSPGPTGQERLRVGPVLLGLWRVLLSTHSGA